MNAAFRIILWYLIFNLCTGVLLTIFPVFEEQGGTGGLEYNEDDGLLFIDDMNKSVSPDSSLTDESSTLDAAMNYIQLGFIWRWLSVIDNLMYGSINVIDNILGNFYSDNEQRLYILSILKGFITIGYILAAFSLWTEKDI